MTDSVASVADRPAQQSSARFGRVVVWHEESPLALTIAVSIACALFGGLWLLMLRPVRPPVVSPAVSLQPIVNEVLGLQDGSAEQDSAEEALDESSLDSVARDVPELPAVPQAVQPSALVIADVESGNIAQLMRETALALNRAEELLQARRASQRDDSLP